MREKDPVAFNTGRERIEAIQSIGRFIQGCDINNVHNLAVEDLGSRDSEILALLISKTTALEQLCIIWGFIGLSLCSDFWTLQLILGQYQFT